MLLTTNQEMRNVCIVSNESKLLNEEETKRSSDKKENEHSSGLLGKIEKGEMLPTIVSRNN